jgi:hypothetical protein
MSTNDTKIRELLVQIETKKAQVGTRPRASWKTNGLIGNAKVNINTVSSVGTCLDLAAELLQKQEYKNKAAQLLEVTAEADPDIADGLDDLKLRVSILKYETEKKKLTALEAKLKDLRSNDAKTEDAIAELANLL